MLTQCSVLQKTKKRFDENICLFLAVDDAPVGLEDYSYSDSSDDGHKKYRKRRMIFPDFLDFRTELLGLVQKVFSFCVCFLLGYSTCKYGNWKCGPCRYNKQVCKRKAIYSYGTYGRVCEMWIFPLPLHNLAIFRFCFCFCLIFKVQKNKNDQKMPPYVFS